MVGELPPFVITELKLEVLPEQDAIEILIDGRTGGITFTVIEFDVILTGLTQDKLDVSTHVTTCPLVNDNVVNVGLLLPVLLPLTNH